jgi:DNA-binding NtrC family response regulator
MAHILVVDDEEGFRIYVARVLEMAGHRVEQAADGQEALRATERVSFDVVITDLSMPKMHGMDLVHHLRERQPEIEIIVLTSHGSVQTAVEAMKLGVFDFIEKPLDGPEQVTMLVRRGLERRRLLALREQTARQQGDDSPKSLSYGDPAMELVKHAIAKVAPTDATVLLRGESGTGKEVVAGQIRCPLCSINSCVNNFTWAVVC